MSASAPPTPHDALIAGRFAVDLARPLADAAGGLAAFAAIDRTGAQDTLMAVQVQRRLPARAQAIAALTAPIEGVLTPIARGPAPAPGGEMGFFLIAPAPPGPPLLTPARPWSEIDLLDRVLRPAARALDRLAQRGVTHRAIRPGNVFLTPIGLVLGMAWAAPAAMHQPVAFEPPYSAMCLPAGRGEGSIADDVYALGVLLLTLALGRRLLPGVADQEVVRRKLTLGSFAALAGDARLPSAIADLARGMLAEDPEHRPSPALLNEPGAARARRLAARPPRRAQRPLEIAGMPVWNTRTLAHMLAQGPDAGIRALRAGVADQWLRRGLGEPTLAARLDEVLRHRAFEADDTRSDAVAAMHAIALLDPLAPLCWRGAALWPDGFGPALAAADAPQIELLTDLAATEALTVWSRARPDRCDVPHLRAEARRYRGCLAMTGLGGGIERLTCMLNPLLPCASPLVGSAWVSRLADLLAALEARATTDRPAGGPIDRHVAAFIAARSDRRMEDDLAALDRGGPGATLIVLAQLQTRFTPVPVPALAAWLAEAPGLIARRGKDRRARLSARLREMAADGQLAPMLMLLHDPGEQEADAREARAAAVALVRIEQVLADGPAAAAARAALARRWGHELATGVGLAGLAVALIVAAFG